MGWMLGQCWATRTQSANEPRLFFGFFPFGKDEIRASSYFVAFVAREMAFSAGWPCDFRNDAFHAARFSGEFTEREKSMMYVTS